MASVRHQLSSRTFLIRFNVNMIFIARRMEHRLCTNTNLVVENGQRAKSLQQQLACSGYVALRGKGHCIYIDYTPLASSSPTI